MLKLLQGGYMKSIVVAGGCFWGVDHYFSLVKGITNNKVVYANSNLAEITYEQACSGQFNAVEAVYLEYDDAILDLEKIVELLFRIIDPTSLNRQGGDIGVQYRTGIYTNDLDELVLLENLMTRLQIDHYKDIKVEVANLVNYYDAEDYHQLYLVKNPNGYCHVDFSKLKQEEKK